MHHPNSPHDEKVPKLSIEECRASLKGIDLTDEEVERVRDALYVLVRKVFDEAYPW